MRNKNVFEKCTGGEAYIKLMYEKMDENGVVVIPGWYTLDEPEHRKRCTLRWSEADCEAMRTKFARLKKLLAAFSQEYVGEDAAALQQVLTEEAFDVWNTYLRPLDLSKFDMCAIMDIDERLTCDVPITDEEYAMYDQYEKACKEQVAQRVGNNLCAYEEFMRAKRYCRLLALKAPEMICRNEEKTLAAAMVCHAFGENVETV